MPVIKGVGYVLIHAPNILYHNGSSQTTERLKAPQSEYLASLPGHLRTFAAALAYPPNQAFIGNIDLTELRAMPRPWYERPAAQNTRLGRFGEIMPEDELYGLLKIADSFDLVFLEADFLAAVKAKLASHKLLSGELLNRLAGGRELADIEAIVANQGAEGLYLADRLVGCVRRAHEMDENLSAHIILENLVAKASALPPLLHLLASSGVGPAEVDYIIECSEEACGDMNQRGGGNFAKAIGEMAGLLNATGSDVRGFCAGPAHALLQAAALVKSGAFNNVVVVGGGTVAKLGMNGKDHVAKKMPVLEDMLGAFALLISRDDGINPLIRLDAVGKHNIGTGSSPQQVMKALVAEPLAKLGRKIADIDCYSGELQNPELTEPAGAGNVAESNYRMIAALAVMAGEMELQDIPQFVEKHGLPGFAPTQGHIPSGVPALGYIREQMLAGAIGTAMLIGKGSLFLGRMTSLFDGLSLIIEKNPGLKREDTQLCKGDIRVLTEAVDALSSGEGRGKIRVGVTLLGSELGLREVLAGAELAQSRLPEVEVVAIGPAELPTLLSQIPVANEAEGHVQMDRFLEAGELHAAVTMHYNFPIGTATIGLVVTPGRGRKMFIAATSGTSSADRVEGIVRNAIYGIAAAKAHGLENPTIGILNIDGARQAERILTELKDRGYPISFAASSRNDGGLIMRGNDLLAGTPDVMVTDSLTGNVLMKVFSAYTTGGSYESLGYGYGPGVGEGYGKIVTIISRASGAPVIAGAIEYAAAMARGKLPALVLQETVEANRAGLAEIARPQKSHEPAGVTAPPKKPVSSEIVGIDVLELEDIQRLLWQEDIYAETGMGCTGPVIMVADDDLARTRQILRDNNIIKS